MGSIGRDMFGDHQLDSYSYQQDSLHIHSFPVHCYSHARRATAAHGRLTGETEMKWPNHAAPGNGAITISFHAGRLGRAVPEPQYQAGQSRVSRS